MVISNFMCAFGLPFSSVFIMTIYLQWEIFQWICRIVICRAFSAPAIVCWSGRERGSGTSIGQIKNYENLVKNKRVSHELVWSRVWPTYRWTPNLWIGTAWRTHEFVVQSRSSLRAQMRRVFYKFKQEAHNDRWTAWIALNYYQPQDSCLRGRVFQSYFEHTRVHDRVSE